MSLPPRPASEAFVRRRFPWMLAALLIGCAFVYLIGNERVSLWDRDEPRYAQTSRQMLQSGDWVLPHFLNEVRNAKPIGIYWCQAASMAMLGDTAAAARLPSALAMLCVIVLLGIALRAEVGPVRGFWAAFIFSTCLLTIILAKMCMTDAVLLLPITVEQICLYVMWHRRASWPIVICFAAAVGVAGLIKGPVALAYPAATLAALLLIGLVPVYGQRRARHLVSRPLSPSRVVIKCIVAFAVILAIVGPWVYQVMRRDPAFIGSSLWKNVFLRTVQPAEQHSGPPGYYLLTIWVCEFPWSLFLPAAIFTAWRHRRVPALRFALAATIGPWLMFECIRTKLPHYLLPIYPALALMTADAVVRASRRTITDLSNPAFRGVLVIWQIVVALLGLFPFLAAHWFHLWPMTYLWMGLFALAVMHLAIGAGVLAQGRVRLAIGRMGVRMLICCAIAWGLVLPTLDFLQIPRRVAAALVVAGATRADRTVMIDYKEPSLAFYQGGTIEEIPDKLYLVDKARSHWPRWIITDRRVWDMMPPRVQHDLRIVTVVHGLNYADGMRISDVLVIENPLPPPPRRTPGSPATGPSFNRSGLP